MMIRKNIAILALAAALPSLALAMPYGDGEHGGKRGHGERMFHQLDLSKEQQREMRRLMGEQMKQRHEITQRYLDKLPDAQRQAMQKDLEASRQATHKAMRDLLKPEQQKAFDDALKAMEAKHQERAEFQQWKAERDAKQ